MKAAWRGTVWMAEDAVERIRFLNRDGWTRSKVALNARAWWSLLRWQVTGVPPWGRR